MANLSDRLSQNVAGKYYVDSSCIDCDQCRVAAPDFFGRDDSAGMSYVVRQPATQEEIDLLEQTIGDCATSSIGNDGA
jgi:ferredoxin